MVKIELAFELSYLRQCTITQRKRQSNWRWRTLHAVPLFAIVRYGPGELFSFWMEATRSSNFILYFVSIRFVFAIALLFSPQHFKPLQLLYSAENPLRPLLSSFVATSKVVLFNVSIWTAFFLSHFFYSNTGFFHSFQCI